MMRALDILAVARVEPAVVEQCSLLGRMMPACYHHLYDPAGAFSRPETVRRGVTTMWSRPYLAAEAEADVRGSDLAAEAAGLVAERWRGSVGTVLHAQCALDQQILGSTPLRVRNTLFPAAREVHALGQLGTAGLATALALMRDFGSDDPARPLAAISAADKWIAPFYRKLGDVVFDDGAAACIVGPAGFGVRPPATVHEIVFANGAPLANLFRASAGDTAAFLCERATAAIAKLQVPPRDARLAGDILEGDLAARIAEVAGLPILAGPAGHAAHGSSAGVLRAIAQGVAAAAAAGRTLPLVVWTASLSGNAAALRVDCHPDADPIAGGWSAQGRAFSTQERMPA